MSAVQEESGMTYPLDGRVHQHHVALHRSSLPVTTLETYSVALAPRLSRTVASKQCHSRVGLHMTESSFNTMSAALVEDWKPGALTLHRPPMHVGSRPALRRYGR